jgi:hypothetical protein
VGGWQHAASFLHAIPLLPASPAPSTSLQTAMKVVKRQSTAAVQAAAAAQAASPTRRLEFGQQGAAGAADASAVQEFVAHIEQVGFSAGALRDRNHALLV